MLWPSSSRSRKKSTRSRLRGKDVESELPPGLDLSLTSDPSRYFQRRNAFVHSEPKPRRPSQHLSVEIAEDGVAMRQKSRMMVSEKPMGTKVWCEKLFRLQKTRSRDELQSGRRDAEAVRPSLGTNRDSFRAHCAHQIVNLRY